MSEVFQLQLNVAIQILLSHHHQNLMLHSCLLPQNHLQDPFPYSIIRGINIHVLKDFVANLLLLFVHGVGMIECSVTMCQSS